MVRQIITRRLTIQLLRTKETSGYSIRVDDVYVSGNAVYADFKLIGPAEGEQVNEVSTTPYIVLKYEKRDESVVFKM